MDEYTKTLIMLYKNGEPEKLCSHITKWVNLLSMKPQWKYWTFRDDMKQMAINHLYSEINKMACHNDIDNFPDTWVVVEAKKFFQGYIEVIKSSYLMPVPKLKGEKKC